MRRKEREITDLSEIENIIRKCDCCRIALYSDTFPYIVPLNFGFVRNSGQLIFYFHGARNGRKIALLNENPNVGFELDTSHELVSQEAACSYSFCYQSVIGGGKLSTIDDDDERITAFQSIMAQYTGKADWTFDPKVLQATMLLKLVVTEISGKQHLQENSHHPQ